MQSDPPSHINIRLPNENVQEEEEEEEEGEHKKYVHKEEEQEEEEDTVPVIPVGCISISAALIIMGQMLTRHSGIRVASINQI